MVAYIKNKDEMWYCTNCRMRQSGLIPRCSFCGAEFTNYIEQVIDSVKALEEEERVNTIHRT